MNRRIAAALGWTLLIIIACSIPGDRVPGPQGPGIDKVAHFVLFAVFAVLWHAALETQRGPARAYILIGGLLLAGLTEIYQGLLPFDREPDLFDALANAAGLFCGALGMAYRRSALRRNRSHPGDHG